MKRSIFIFIMALAAFEAIGQIDFSKLSFSASSQPEQDGSTINSSMGYAFSDSLSSSIRLRRLVTATIEKLDLGVDSASGKALATSSQNIKRSDITELFIMPVEFTLDIWKPSGISVGAGLYASLSGIHDVGFFKLDTSIPSFSAFPKTNSYDSESSSQFYGPVLTFDTKFATSFLTLQPQIVIVPIFFFSEKSSLEIDPLLASAGKGQIGYSSTGLPYFVVAVTGRLFNLISLDISYEMSRQNAQILSPPDGASHTAWWGDAKAITSTSFKAIGSVIIPFGGNGELRLGGGSNMSTTGIEGGTPVTTMKPVFNIAYSVNK